MYRPLKRMMDALLSLLALMILWPLLLVLMLLVRIDSPGSPVFAQTRIGLHGKAFTIYKLRTMKREAPRSVATGKLQDAKSHITRLGAFLRKTSLDELPQFFNILCGHMSLVGPRPLVPEEEDVHRQRQALGAYAVRPGVTGWAQINGRDTVNAGKKAEMDAWYAAHLSFGLDVRIVLKTIACVLTGSGIEEGAAAESSAAAGDTRPAGKDADA